MSRQVIPPSRPSALSPTTQAFALLQKRLHTAEAETANMVRQLTDFGFPLDTKPQPKTDHAQPADPIAPFLPATADAEVLHKHYEALVSRMCRTESQLQTLKLNLCALQAERDLGQEAASSVEHDERLRGYDEEVQTLKMEIARIRKDWKESLELRNKAENEARNLRYALETANTSKSELEMACNELMTSQEEIGQKNSELRDELARESRLRISLEESHFALLDMIREMEGVVDKERHEVKMLSTDCLELRNEGAKVQEEKKQYHALQTRFQEMIRGLQDDIDAKEIQLTEAREEQKVLVSTLNAVKRENGALLREIQDFKIALEEAQESTVKRLKDEITALKNKSQNSVETKGNLLNKTASELHTARMTIQQLENELQQEQDLSSRRESDFSFAIQARAEAYQECQRLKGQLVVMADREKQKAASYQRHLSNTKNDESKMAARLDGFMRSNRELQAAVENLQTELGRKDSELTALRSDRQRSQKSMTILQEEVERLRENLEMLENSQLASRHSDLDKAFNESNSIAVSNLLEANGKLQATVKQLESELKKQNQRYRILQEMREAERTTLKHRLQASETRLQSLQQQTATKRDASSQNTTKELRHLQRTNEDLASRLKESLKTDTELRAKLASLEETCSKQKDRIRSQKMQLEAGARLRKTNQEMTHKIKDISHQLSEMERAKKEYALRNSEQAKTVASFVNQVAGLQADLQALASSQESLTSSARKNQEMAKAQTKLQRKATDLQDALIRLQQEKTDADVKLMEASNESIQISTNLEEAQSLFRTQYHALQQELQETRQRQAELERTNVEQQQQLIQERTRAAEQAVKARNIIKASRQALTHLASQAESDHKTTRSQMEKMMQRLQVEKDHSTFTDNKLQKFMEISGQYIEELAMDLDQHRHRLVEASFRS